MSKYVKLEEVIETVYQCRKAEANDEWIKRWLEPLNSLPTIEVSEDCISRKWLEENAKEFGDYYENTVWAVPLSVLTDAPSVVPKTQIETQNSNENSNEDAISREWLISFIDAGHLRNPNELCYSERGVVELIKHAPSVVPSCQKNRQVGRAEGEWIPCSEKLPDNEELMLVTYTDPRPPEAMDIWIGWHEMENVWYIDGEAHSNELGNEVIAWMPLPKPWKGAE